MVNYDPKVWLSLVFHSNSRYVMRTLTPAVLIMSSLSAVLCYLLLDFFEFDFKTTIAMHSLLGIVLGLFLVFRTNSAYDRWWEGRKLWGSLLNNTRNLSFKLNAFLEKEDKENRTWFAVMISNFSIAVKEHLRNGVAIADLEPTDDIDFIDAMGAASHVPNKLSALFYERIMRLFKDNKLTGDQLLLLDKELKEFADILGGCERIRNTPIPYSYSIYIKQFIFIYVVTLPFAFVESSGYMTIPIVGLITFVLLSVELIAEEIEDPFGKDVNDLPTDALCVKIKSNVREILLDEKAI
jgi:putative membrane protein